MPRTLILDAIKKLGEKLQVSGWVTNVRDHGKITFLDLRDRTGVIQCVGESLPKLSPETVVEIIGKVVKRPENLVNEKLKTGHFELQIEKLEVISKAEELPFDLGKEELNLELPTLLDWRPLTLRHKTQRRIFKVQANIAESFRNAATALGCLEIFPPTISASSTEGGTEVFKVKYYEHDAFLVQSPQLYKQMMVPVFERVFIFSHVYRAEPSVTTRHLSELVQMDCEMAFVDFNDLLDALEFVGTSMVKGSKVKGFLIPGKIPRLKLREAQEIIEKRTGRNLKNEPDLNPEDEKEICEWAKETHKSDFVTITHFPTKKRAFYTLPDPKDPEYSLSYDLLFKGIEISSGSQRINDYGELVKAIESRGMNPKSFEMYLQAFKFGMPPEGGFSFGIERLTMKVLDLDNVRQASLFPRDMERVDVRLSTLQEK